jgi:prolyl-tRNA synthetase
MYLTPVGEDTIVLCGNCGYKANMEAAECVVANDGDRAESHPLAKVHTPDMKTMDDVCGFLNIALKDSCKAVAYRKTGSDELYVVFIRGDLEINEVKLRNHLGCDVKQAVDIEDGGLAGGFMGPRGLVGNVAPLYDNSLKGARNICCGANEADYHYTGLDIERDVGIVKYGDFAKVPGGGESLCPLCGGRSLNISRGIEVGNIFQLGRKYTESMIMHFTDECGDSHFPVMGCYGIGVGRLAASVCEERHDDFGPIWPISIAPWHVHICCLRADDKIVKEASDGIYKSLLDKKVEVIYDDRVVSAGVMFSDADLLGVPVRVIVSPRGLKEGCCELVTRDKRINRKASINDAADAINELLAELSAG